MLATHWKNLLLATSCVALLALAGRASPATVYDAAVDLKTFEQSVSGAVPGNNTVVPAWSYGTEVRLNPVIGGIPVPDSTTFTVFPTSTHSDAIALPGVTPGDLQGWQYDNPGDLVPAVAANMTSGTVHSSCCGDYAPGTIWTHPGQLGSSFEFAVVRWTAPSAGVATIDASWVASGGSNPAEAYILSNGVPLYTGATSASGAVGPLDVPVTAGQTIEFAVGPNPSQNYGGNSTQFEGTITLVPEPSTLMLFGCGLLGLLVYRKRNGLSR